MLESKYKIPIEHYYARRESRWGYKYLLAGNKHYGFYEDGKRGRLKKAVTKMCDVVATELDLPEGAVVLDAGCGEGPLAFRLANEYKHRVTGLDILKKNIELANSKKKNKDNPNFIVGDFSDTKLPNDSFDGVVILEALVHSPDYKKTLEEVHRILKPGGVLVTHNYVMPDKMTPEQEHVFRVVYESSGMNTLDQFRLNKMASIWEEAGFVNVRSKDGIKEITPMMRTLHRIAFLPYHIAKMLNREENYTNMYAGYWMYKLRPLIRYDMAIAYKPAQ